MCCFIPLVLGFVAGRSCDFRGHGRDCDTRCYERKCCKERCCSYGRGRRY